MALIGHGVGTMAISGLALTFPLMNLAAAFGSLVGVGASTLISVKLGQRDYDTAQRVLGNVFVLNMVLGVAFTIIVMLFLDPILYFFGGSDQTVGYARDYMQIILLGNAVTHLYLGLNAVLRSSGHPQKSMYATIATVVIKKEKICLRTSYQRGSSGLSYSGIIFAADDRFTGSTDL